MASNLQDLLGTPSSVSGGIGITVDGTVNTLSDRAGIGVDVAAIGDFNGDGQGDFVISAPGYDLPHGNRAEAGGVYLVYGGSTLAARIADGRLDLGDGAAGEVAGNGLLFVGALSEDVLQGTGAGDVNGDGFADVFLTAASFVDSTSTDPLVPFDHRPGTAYIVYGGPGAQALAGADGVTVDLANLPAPGAGNPAITEIRGEADTLRTGLSSTAGGDLNGDGFADLALGTFQASGPNYNPDGSVVAPPSLPEIPTIPGLPGLPDVPGVPSVPGLPDASAFIGADGRVYGLFGSSTMPAVIDLGADIANGDGTRGFVTRGFLETRPDGEGGFSPEFFGSIGFFGTLAMADLDGNGRDELLLSSPFGGTYIENGPDDGYAPGGVFALNIGGTGTPAEIDLRTAAFLQGETTGEFTATGIKIANLGDINGDGLDDIGLSAPLLDSGNLTNPGAVYGILGDAGTYAGAQISGRKALTSQTDFRILGRNQGDGADPGLDLLDDSGAVAGVLVSGMSGIGDVNGDGVDDFAVGLANANGDNGAVYVVLGRTGQNTGPTAGMVNLGDIVQFDSGVAAGTGRIGITRIDGANGELIGASLGGPIDINGDGRAEIMIGAPGPLRVLPGGEQEGLTDGRIYIVTPPINDTSGALTLLGTLRNDLLEGGAGNDRVAGSSGADAVRGLAGDDAVYGDTFEIGMAPEVSAQIYRLYLATLGRQPDTVGHLSWTQNLTEGRISLAEAANGFVASPEFSNTYGNLDNSGFVTLLYSNVLNRAPDDAGLQGWLAQMAAGQSRADVVLGFSESREYIGNTAAGASAFTDANSATGWTDDVYRLYQATLNRDPDAAGLLGWTEQLGNGTPFATTVAGFVNSAEFQNTYGTLNDADFVTLLYRNVLNREPDADGLAGWTAQLGAGTARETVVQGFSQSAEFIAASAPGLKAWAKAQGVQDVVSGGSGNNVVAGGVLSDQFVFSVAEGGTHRVLDAEPWDVLQFAGFGYGSVSDARTHMADTPQGTVFADQGVTVTLDGVALAQITDDMILV